MNTFQPRWSSQTKIVVSLVMLAAAIYLISRFSAIFAPAALSVILAYVLSPSVNFFEARLRIRRGFAVLLAYLLTLVGIGILLMLIIPPLINQFAGLNLDFQLFLQRVESFLGRRYIIAGQVIDLESIFQQSISSLQGILEPVFGETLGFAVEVITSLVWVIFILVVSFYLVKDARKLREWFDGLVPPGYRDDYVRIRDLISQIWAAFFRGQIVLAMVVATIFTVVGFIIGLPFAMAMAVLAGLLEFLPSVGHAIWLAIASILAFFAGSTWIGVPNWVFMLIVIGLHLVFEQFDLNYLIPRIIGRSVHLPPLVVILGIVTGAVLAGVLGILLAAPTIASIRVVSRYIYAKLFDMDPFPVVDVPSLPPPDPRWWRKAVVNEQVDAAPVNEQKI